MYIHGYTTYIPGGYTWHIHVYTTYIHSVGYTWYIHGYPCISHVYRSGQHIHGISHVYWKSGFHISLSESEIIKAVLNLKLSFFFDVQEIILGCQLRIISILSVGYMQATTKWFTVAGQILHTPPFLGIPAPRALRRRATIVVDVCIAVPDDVWSLSLRPQLRIYKYWTVQ